MYRLSDLYENILRKPLPTQCGICCEIVDPHMAKLNRLLTESISCFSYTLVMRGTAIVSYDDKTTNLAKNDILIYTPGMLIKTLEISDDFSALCLMGDEAITYEIPYARNVISASYFPALAHSENKLSLSDCEAQWLENRLKEIYLYTTSNHIYKEECLYSLYSLFILDLLNAENRFRKDRELNGPTIDLFLKFMKLVTENFLRHHDISFYADKLAVTTIYLSRIVKRFSGQTVKNHVDRLLLMESSYLLRSTDEPISIIAERLNFANPASFSKFFTKQKGISPREYRGSGPFS
ncbi:MAG: AraC family transcriptional regulator [Bacteroides sp.]|nr:AraC family transcriptional regulator [Bacteroides sp.]